MYGSPTAAPVVPPPQQPFVATPAPPQFPAPPPPAVAARQRKNQSIDAKRRQGTQLRNAVKKQSPTPSYLQGMPMLPQKAATPPPEQQVPFTPAQYKAPNKGMEYIAAGLALLFPGAPIARAATGLIGGLNQGAEQGYQRREGQAEQQYAVAQNQAATAAANKKAQFDAQQQAAQNVYQNAVAKWNEGKEARARGLNPLTGNRFQFPSPQSLLPMRADPKTGKPVQDTSYAGYAQAFNSLAVKAQQVGADDIAKDYSGQAAEYNKLAIDDANNQRAMALALYNQNQQNNREDKREAAAEQRQETSEANQNARSDRQYNLEMARLDRADSNQMLNLQSQATRSYASFRNEWTKALAPQTVLVNGQPSTKPGLISGKSVGSLSQIFSRIDQGQDPAGLAKWYSDQNGNQTAKRLILDRGEAAQLYRRSQGRPIIPQKYGPQVTPRHGISDDEQLRSAGIDPNNPGVKTEVQSAKAAGVTDIGTIIATLKQHGFAGVSPSPVPAPAQTPNPGQ